MDEVNSIFEPRSVLLIGSSKTREKVGMTSPQLFNNITGNMRKYYRGRTLVFDTHQKGHKANLMQVGESADLAVIMLPAKESIPICEECAKIGIRALLIITGGYREEQRAKLLGIKQKYKTRILGPNTIMGIINTSNGLNTTFEKNIMPKKGNIAVISQSGGVGAYLLDWACFYEVGISKFCFVGDKIDVNDVELLRYLGRDDQTGVICIYLEGIKDGRNFIEEARRISKRKPILVLKGGITQESAHRAKSHTASIAGSDAVFDAALKKAGIIRVDNIEDLMNAAVVLSKQPPMQGDNVAIVSNVGGPAILAADAVSRNCLALAALSKETKRRIESRYPGVDATNPIDMIADAKGERYSEVLGLVLADKNVDGVLIINMLKSTFFEPKDAKVIPKVASKYPGKPVVDVPAGGEDFVRLHKVLGRTDVPLFNLPEKAARALKVLRIYDEILKKH